MSGLEKIGVVGAGAWGSALALVAARAGRDVLIWAHEPDTADDINENKANSAFLPDVIFDAPLRATVSLDDMTDRDALLLVMPAQHLGTLAATLARGLPDGTPAIICAKGIEQKGNRLLSEVLAQACPQAVPAILSGPSFAADVARGLPTAVTLACADLELAERLAAAISLPAFRPYMSCDLVGAQIGGAVKNVLAIACGVCEGKGLGASARAALTTRGFAELSRFGRALGAKPETLGGLSGLGDLVLTCNSPQSRNMSLGIALGRGETMETILAGRRAVTEGVHTATAVMDRARSLGIDMPICAAVEQVIAGRLGVDEAIVALLSRPLREEGT